MGTVCQPVLPSGTFSPGQTRQSIYILSFHSQPNQTLCTYLQFHDMAPSHALLAPPCSNFEKKWKHPVLCNRRKRKPVRGWHASASLEKRKGPKVPEMYWRSESRRWFLTSPVPALLGRDLPRIERGGKGTGSYAIFPSAPVYVSEQRTQRWTP